MMSFRKEDFIEGKKSSLGRILPLTRPVMPACILGYRNITKSYMEHTGLCGNPNAPGMFMGAPHGEREKTEGLGHGGGCI